MGKSRGWKKKSPVSSNLVQNHDKVAVGDNSSSTPVANGGQDFDSSAILQKAHELKEEGNRKFQEKDFVGALQLYENALKLSPRTHPERAIFHGNRAACLMLIKPIDYEAVISECTLSLQIQPSYVRPLLRRALAYEAIGKYEMAMQDAQFLLAVDPNHRDALEIAGRLRMALNPRQVPQQDLHSHPSPAALGDSAVGASISDLDPCLPARPLLSKMSSSSVSGQSVPSPKSEKLYPVPKLGNGPQLKTQMRKVVLKPSTGSSIPSSDTHRSKLNEPLAMPFRGQAAQVNLQFRPLKLIYDHDIRLAQMPVNCSFKVLRDVVSKRFPMSKWVHIKYMDSDRDLVTITCSAELRYAETSVDQNTPKDADSDKSGVFPMLKLHIVEVGPEQEPEVPEEEDVDLLEVQEPKGVNVSNSSTTGSSVDVLDYDAANTDRTVKKLGAADDSEFKEDVNILGFRSLREDDNVSNSSTDSSWDNEVEFDDWLFELAQQFRSYFDPDAHLKLHKIWMGMCSEALEETIASEKTQGLFDKAALKFQEVAALAYLNWGNVHLCDARKKIPMNEFAVGKFAMKEHLEIAIDWVKEKYNLAREKYEQSLSIKPDFYEGLLALAQLQFDMAKFQRSHISAMKQNLSKWDLIEILDLFENAEEKLKAAIQMFEKFVEEKLNELKNPNQNKKDEQLLKRKKNKGDLNAQSDSSVTPREISAESVAQQAGFMRSHIHLFSGNLLFEKAQVECQLGLPGFRKNVSDAVKNFKISGVPKSDIAIFLKCHM